MASRISRVLCSLGRPVALGTGRWGSMQLHSASERSLWYPFLMLGILPSEHLRTPFQTVSIRSSQTTPMSMGSGRYLPRGLPSLQQLQRPPGEEVGGVAVGVLLALVVYGRVLVPQQSRLLDEVGHGVSVALGADLKARFVRRPARVGPGPLFAEGLGIVYDPKQPKSVGPCLGLDGAPPCLPSSPTCAVRQCTPTAEAVRRKRTPIAKRFLTHELRRTSLPRLG